MDEIFRRIEYGIINIKIAADNNSNTSDILRGIAEIYDSNLFQNATRASPYIVEKVAPIVFIDSLDSVVGTFGIFIICSSLTLKLT